MKSNASASPSPIFSSRTKHCPSGIASNLSLTRRRKFKAGSFWTSPLLPVPAQETRLPPPALWMSRQTWQPFCMMPAAGEPRHCSQACRPSPGPVPSPSHSPVPRLPPALSPGPPLPRQSRPVRHRRLPPAPAATSQLPAAT